MQTTLQNFRHGIICSRHTLKQPCRRFPAHCPPAKLSHPHICQASTATASTPAISQETIKQLDLYLEQGGEDSTNALKLVTELKEQGKLKGFAGAHQVPKRQYTIEEMRLNNIDAATLLSPEDKSLNKVRNGGMAAAVAGLIAFSAYVGIENGGQVLGLLFGVIFLLFADQIVNQGGGEALIVDSVGRLAVRTYARRVALHEAGHFLVAYLLGLLPRAYTLSAWEAFSRYRTLNLQAGTQFCDASFRKQVESGRLPASSLDSYACVALSGVVTEALCYGQAEGGVGDIAQLDSMLKALGFTQKKADGEIRWAVLNVAAILRRHADIHADLADAMQKGASVGTCIALIEEKLKNVEDI